MLSEWDAAANVFVTDMLEAGCKQEKMDEDYQPLPEKQASPAGLVHIVLLAFQPQLKHCNHEIK